MKYIIAKKTDSHSIPLSDLEHLLDNGWEFHVFKELHRPKGEPQYKAGCKKRFSDAQARKADLRKQQTSEEPRRGLGAAFDGGIMW